MKIFNTESIGIFALATDKYVFVPLNSQESSKRLIREKTGTEVVELGIGGISAVGAMVAANNNGVMLPYNADDEDVLNLKHRGFNVIRSRSKYNALGNLLAVNSRVGFASPILSDAFLDAAEDILGVELFRVTIGGLNTIGSALVLTDKGFACHPETSEEELELVRARTRLDGARVTVNGGYPYIRSGMISNSSSVLVGYATTGIEMAEIENALGIA